MLNTPSGSSFKMAESHGWEETVIDRYSYLPRTDRGWVPRPSKCSVSDAAGLMKEGMRGMSKWGAWSSGQYQ